MTLEAGDIVPVDVNPITSAPNVAEYSGQLQGWSRDAKSYAFVTQSIYENSADASTLQSQGCTAGSNSTQGVVILDFGRPAYDSGTGAYGAIDFNNGFVSYGQMEQGAESYAFGYAICKAGGKHLYVAIGMNNSCSNEDPSCTVAKMQPPDFGTAGRKLDDWVITLQSYMNNHGLAGIETASAADDAEPSYDPGPVGCTKPCNGGHTYEFLSGYDQEDSPTGTTHILWDFGSNEAGFWTNDMEWYAAYNGPQYDFGQVYTAGMAQDWENLAYWADTAGGGYRGFWVSGVTNQYPACVQGVCYKPQQSYNAMLSKLDYAGTSSPTYQSHIDYITNI